MFGAALIGGLTYLQYQASQAGNYAMDTLSKGKEMVMGFAGGLTGGAKDIAGQTKTGWERTKEGFELPPSGLLSSRNLHLTVRK